MANLKAFFLSSLLPACMAAAPVVNCPDLAPMSFGPDVKIESAKLVAKTDALPEHCDIRGTIWPEAKFAVKLPTEWNERFQMVGNGGWAGTISFGAMDLAVKAGYATTSTDTGHDEKKEPGASFAYPGPKNPNAARKVIDHGYLSVHETALLAKKIIHTYYGRDARYSYWVGCSTGGKQGLSEAQRYPEDFDGYVVGAPVLFYAELQMKAIWNAHAVLNGAGTVRAEKLRTLSDAVVAKCDMLDGVKDGVLENPLVCKFDPGADLPKCAGDSDAATCFTPAQIAGIRKVYDGVRNSAGTLLFPGLALGSEVFGPPAGRQGQPVRSGWDGSLTNSFNIANSFFKFMAFDNPPGEKWDFLTFDFDKDPDHMRATAFAIDSTIPDLTAVKVRGGKIVHYHGWSDPGVTPKMSVNYYEAAMKAMGDKDTHDFYRFFPVPGMFHCGGGPGCGNVDWLSAVVNWVEKGQAPDSLVGGHVEGGKITKTHLLCPYPEVARYKGTGNPDAAESYACGVQTATNRLAAD
jgi:feruloyl esterase